MYKYLEYKYLYTVLGPGDVDRNQVRLPHFLRRGGEGRRYINKYIQ